MDENINMSIDAFEKCVFIDLNNVEYRFCLAYTMHQNGRFEDASIHYEQCIQLLPRHLRASHNYAYLLYQMEQYEKSLQLFDKAVRLAKLENGVETLLSALVGRGRVKFKLSKSVESLADAELALKLKHSDRRALLLKATCLAFSGDMGNAIKSCERILALGKCYEAAKLLFEIFTAAKDTQKIREMQKILDDTVEPVTKRVILGIRFTLKPQLGDMKLSPSHFVRPSDCMACHKNGRKCEGNSCY